MNHQVIVLLSQLFLLLLFQVPGRVNAQDPDLTRPWDARWIFSPEKSSTEYGVFHFRRTFNVDHKPDSFVIHISADNRYRLFLNGKRCRIRSGQR